MGKRGPHRTPTPILEARGSSLAAARKATEPKARTGIPPRPRTLDATARAAWKRLTRELAEMGVLALVDQSALARYCQLLSDWREARKELAESGRYITVLSREGNPRQAVNPAAIDAGVLAAQLLRLEQQFGLTPAARAGLAKNPEDGAGGQDADDDYFGDARSA